jgi:hypothetical protein
MLRRRYPRPITALLLVMAAVAFIACSSQDDTTDPGTQPGTFLTGPSTPADQPITLHGPGDSAQPTCSLLDAAELSRIAGEPMGNPSSIALGPPLGQQVCTFGALASGSYTIAQVSLVAQDGLAASLRDDGFTVQRLFDETFTMFPNAILVPGIGDAAFRHKNTLEVLAGEVTFSVSLAYSDGAARRPASLETLVALATIVLDRIEVPG